MITKIKELWKKFFAATAMNENVKGNPVVDDDISLTEITAPIIYNRDKDLERVEEYVSAYIPNQLIEVKIHPDCENYRRKELEEIQGDVTRADIAMCSLLTGRDEAYLISLLSGKHTFLRVSNNTICMGILYDVVMNRKRYYNEREYQLNKLKFSATRKGTQHSSPLVEMRLKAISKSLLHGDIVAVASILKIDESTIRKILKNERSPSTELAGRVLEALEQIIATRESIKGGVQ